MTNATKFDPVQQAIAYNYCNGDMEHVTSVEDAQHCGDGLFTFLINEASDADGNMDEFLRMLDSAIRQLEALRSAL